MRILFLCTELAGYFVNCINTLKQSTNVDIKLIHWPVIANAPFNFILKGVDISDKNSVDLNRLKKSCKDFKPQLVYIAGWADREYLEIAKILKKEGAITIGGLDNPWKPTIRQMMGRLLSRWVIRPYFDYFWVAGMKQYTFARKLGYDHQRILKGVYAADIDKFALKDRTNFNKILLYVGRFESEKGVQILVNTFLSLTDNERNGWTLRMIGNGSLRHSIKSTTHIVVEDFKQPDVLAKTSLDVGGFILPSLYEPWGVVVQEFAAAGLPLLLSNAVNAGEQFLKPGENGYLFEADNQASLKATLLAFFKLDQDKLRIMGRRSFDLAHSITPQDWVKQLVAVANSHQMN